MASDDDPRPAVLFPRQQQSLREMSAFLGFYRPFDGGLLAICDICGAALIPSALKRHVEQRHSEQSLKPPGERNLSKSKKPIPDAAVVGKSKNRQPKVAIKKLNAGPPWNIDEGTSKANNGAKAGIPAPSPKAAKSSSSASRAPKTAPAAASSSSKNSKRRKRKVDEILPPLPPPFPIPVIASPTAAPSSSSAGSTQQRLVDLVSGPILSIPKLENLGETGWGVASSSEAVVGESASVSPPPGGTEVKTERTSSSVDLRKLDPNDSRNLPCNKTGGRISLLGAPKKFMSRPTYIPQPPRPPPPKVKPEKKPKLSVVKEERGPKPAKRQPSAVEYIELDPAMFEAAGLFVKNPIRKLSAAAVNGVPGGGGGSLPSSSSGAGVASAVNSDQNPLQDPPGVLRQSSSSALSITSPSPTSSSSFLSSSPAAASCSAEIPHQHHHHHNHQSSSGRRLSALLPPLDPVAGAAAAPVHGSVAVVPPPLPAPPKVAPACNWKGVLPRDGDRPESPIRPVLLPPSPPPQAPLPHPSVWPHPPQFNTFGIVFDGSYLDTNRRVWRSREKWKKSTDRLRAALKKSLETRTIDLPGGASFQIQSVLNPADDVYQPSPPPPPPPSSAPLITSHPSSQFLLRNERHSTSSSSPVAPNTAASASVSVSGSNLFVVDVASAPPSLRATTAMAVTLAPPPPSSSAAAASVVEPCVPNMTISVSGAGADGGKLRRTLKRDFSDYLNGPAASSSPCPCPPQCDPQTPPTPTSSTAANSMLNSLLSAPPKKSSRLVVTPSPSVSDGLTVDFGDYAGVAKMVGVSNGSCLVLPSSMSMTMSNGGGAGERPTGPALTATVEYPGGRAVRLDGGGGGSIVHHLQQPSLTLSPSSSSSSSSLSSIQFTASASATSSSSSTSTADDWSSFLGAYHHLGRLSTGDAVGVGGGGGRGGAATTTVVVMQQSGGGGGGVPPQPYHHLHQQHLRHHLLHNHHQSSVVAGGVGVGDGVKDGRRSGLVCSPFPLTPDLPCSEFVAAGDHFGDHQAILN